jgi:hypothetical protein
MKKLLLFASATFLSGLAFSQTVVLTQDFETGTPPTGWTVTQNTPSVGFEFGTALGSAYFAVPSHTRYALSNDDAHDDNTTNLNLADMDRLISPVMDLTPFAATGVAVKFQYIQPGTYGSVGTIEVTTDGGTTWAVAGTVANSATWTNGFVDLSSYTTSATVQVCFRHNDGGEWADGFGIDDVSVEELPANEVVVNSVSLTPYGQLSTNYTLSINVTNLGYDPITSLEVNWNDGTDHITTIGSLNILPGATANVNHPTAVNYATVVEKNMAVSVSQVNGAVDDLTNNDGSTIFHTVSSLVQHNVLIEEGTGTWCGWCPRGAVAMAYMTATYPSDFVGIAVHNGDPMTVSAYDAAANFSGFPGCNVERTLLDQSVSQAAFESYYNARKVLVVPASVNVTNTWNYSTRAISATVTAHFVTTFAAANYRLAIVVVEDDVTGTASGYNQTNYYAGGANGPMGGYESLPSPVPAAQMVYDHVGRALLGGYNGQAGSVPAVINDLDDIQYTFNYTLPAGYDETQTKLVGLLIDQSSGAVINAVEVDMNFNAGVEEVSNITLNVYPNPASDLATVKLDMINPEDVTLNLYDLSGKAVYTHNYSALSGTQYLTVPVSGLAKGTYIVSIATPSKSYSEQLIVK